MRRSGCLGEAARVEQLQGKELWSSERRGRQLRGVKYQTEHRLQTPPWRSSKRTQEEIQGLLNVPQENRPSSVCSGLNDSGVVVELEGVLEETVPFFPTGVQSPLRRENRSQQTYILSLIQVNLFRECDDRRLADTAS